MAPLWGGPKASVLKDSMMSCGFVHLWFQLQKDVDSFQTI